MGMHPGQGWWVCIRDTDGGYASGTRVVGMHPGRGWWVWMRAGLGDGARRFGGWDAPVGSRSMARLRPEEGRELRPEEGA